MEYFFKGPVFKIKGTAKAYFNAAALWRIYKLNLQNPFQPLITASGEILTFYEYISYSILETRERNGRFSAARIEKSSYLLH